MSSKADISTACVVSSNAGREQSEIQEVTAVGWQIRNLAITHCVAHAAARSLNHWSFRGDLHGLVPRRYRQRHLEVDLRADRDLHILIKDAESAVRALNEIRPYRKEREGKQSI